MLEDSDTDSNSEQNIDAKTESKTQELDLDKTDDVRYIQ